MRMGQVGRIPLCRSGIQGGRHCISETRCLTKRQGVFGLEEGQERFPKDLGGRHSTNRYHGIVTICVLVEQVQLERMRLRRAVAAPQDIRREARTETADRTISPSRRRLSLTTMTTYCRRANTKWDYETYMAHNSFN